MSFIDSDILDFILTKEKRIKEKYNEIKKIYDEVKYIREMCPDNIVVCVKKDKFFLGKDELSNDRNFCLICGKEINLIKKDSIVIDMSSYETGYTDIKDDIENKMFIVRYEYLDILNNNPDISSEELKVELNRRLELNKTINDSKKKKVLEKTNN